MDDYIIRDSSIWEDYSSTSLLYQKDCSIRVGIIAEEVYMTDLQDTRYIVNVWDTGRIVPVTCIRSSRFGGLFNYEEYTGRGFNIDKNTSDIRSSQPGDNVLIAYINGSAREGVILSQIKHWGRSETIKSQSSNNNENINEFVNKKGPTTVRYVSEFNGIETAVNALGEYRVTFKGQPTNLDKLNEVPNGSELPKPTYDNKVGSSYYEFDKLGSWLVTDNSQDGVLS